MAASTMRVGALALQGDFREHLAVVRRLGVEGIEVRTEEELSSVDALIIPGGESTAIGRLARIYNLIEPLQAAHRRGASSAGNMCGNDLPRGRNQRRMSNHNSALLMSSLSATHLADRSTRSRQIWTFWV